MKPLVIAIPALLACSLSCTNASQKKLEARIDSLEKKLNDTYKPGFGEFMSGIQLHHAKLWFAGINENWDLADFEVQEIMETVDAIKKYETERIESKSIPMIEPALDSVSAAIKSKDLVQFRKNYLLLTNTCNTCHKEVNFSFNEVKIPDNPPFSNQVFQKKQRGNQD
jgi:cytochrome c1